MLCHCLCTAFNRFSLCQTFLSDDFSFGLTFCHAGFGSGFSIFCLCVVVCFRLLPSDFNLLLLQCNVIFTFHLAELQFVLLLLLDDFKTLSFNFQTAFFFFKLTRSSCRSVFFLCFSKDSCIFQIFFLTAVRNIHFSLILLVRNVFVVFCLLDFSFTSVFGLCNFSRFLDSRNLRTSQIFKIVFIVLQV